MTYESDSLGDLGRSRRSTTYRQRDGKQKKKSTGKAAWKQANDIITPLPPAADAAIDKLPIPMIQRSALKKYPLSFLTVLADAGQDKVIEFIKRTQKASGKKSYSHKFGTTSINVYPKKSDHPSLLSAKMITLAHLYPIQAGTVAGQMGMEIGGGLMAAASAAGGSLVSTEIARARSSGRAVSRASAKAGKDAAAASRRASAAAKKASRDASTASKKTSTAAKKAAKKAADDVKKAAAKATTYIPKATVPKMPSLWGYEDDGLGAVPIVAAAAAPAAAAPAAAGGAAATSTTGATFASIVTAVVALAPIVVPALLEMAKGVMPGKPTVAEKNASTNASKPGGMADMANDQIPDEVKNQSGKEGGSSMMLPLVILGGAGIVAAVMLTKKK